MGIVEERKLVKEKYRLEREELLRKMRAEMEVLKEEFGARPRDISKFSKTAKRMLAPMINKYGVDHAIEQLRELDAELNPVKKGGRGKKGA